MDDPNSPMRNEEHYILFLEALLSLPGLPEAERIRPAYRLETTRKNRPGTIAADFAYTDHRGKRQTLHGTPAPGSCCSSTTLPVPIARRYWMPCRKARLSPG